METTLNPEYDAQIIDVLKSIDGRLQRMESAFEAEKPDDKPHIWFNDEDIMDIHQASLFTGLSKSSIYTKVSKRIIPHDRFEGKLFFSKKALSSWREATKVSRKTINT